MKGRINVAHLPGGVLSLQTILSRRHVAYLPRAVHLVTQTPALHLIRFGEALLAAEIAPFCSLIQVAIFDQSGCLFRSSRPKIEAHQGLSAGSLAPRHEFIGAELIGVDRIPGLVKHTGTALLGTHTVEPIVARDKIAPGVTNDGNSHLANFTDDIFAKPIGVR